MDGIAYFESPIGVMRIKVVDEVVREVEFVDAPGDDAFLTVVTQQVLLELAEYFGGKRKEFSVPLAAHGTPFQ